MIAAPLKTRKIDSPILTHFSKAKFFALRDDDGTTNLLINNADSPEHTIDLLRIHGVTTLICAYLTQSTLEHAVKLGMKVYDSGREAISLDEALKKQEQNALIQVPLSVKRYVL